MSPPVRGPEAPADSRERVYTPRVMGLFLAAVGYFTMVGVSFPVLPRLVERELNGSKADIGLAFGVLAIGMLVMRPIGGVLSDRYGRRPLMIVSSLLLAVLQLAHVAAAETGHLWVLLLVRVFTGAASSLMYLAQATTATELPRPEHRDRVFGAFSTVILVGFAIGQLAGEWVMQERGFWAAFSMSAGFAVLTAMVAITLPETKPEGVVPAARIREVLHPVAARVGVVNLVVFVAFMGFNAFIADYAEEFGVEEARWLLLTYSLTTLLMRAGSGRIFARVERRTLITFAFVVVIAGALILSTADSVGQLYVGAFVIAVGMAWNIPLLILIAVDSTPDSDRSRVVATVTMFGDLASSAGSLILGLIAETAGYDGMYLAVSAAAFVALVLVRSRWLSTLSGFQARGRLPSTVRAAPRSG